MAAAKQVSIRISSDGKAEFKRDMQEIGAAGQAAGDQTAKGFQKAGDAADAQAAKLNPMLFGQLSAAYGKSYDAAHPVKPEAPIDLNRIPDAVTQAVERNARAVLAADERAWKEHTQIVVENVARQSDMAMREVEMGTREVEGMFDSVSGRFENFIMNGELSWKSADGGRPPLNQVSIVGERGPELFIPDSAGTIIPNHALRGMGGMVFNVTVNGGGDRYEIQQAVREGVSEAISQSRADLAAYDRTFRQRAINIVHEVSNNPRVKG